MSMKRRSSKNHSGGLDVLGLYNEVPVIQIGDESSPDDAISDGVAPDYVVITDDSILCVSSKAEVDQFQRSCAEQCRDEDSQSVLG